MQRYFFDQCEGLKVRLDHVGMVLPNEAAARQEALCELAEAFSEAILTDTGAHPVIRIRNEQRVLDTVSSLRPDGPSFMTRGSRLPASSR
ncbi:DUF6894 family protein [Bradyrhizobium sp. RDM4]|uniref:DUF6894 family protein n=1 Tax=Bradyrhizobium sp. RDM4 TaxID=3378765 RepID=UPI0038FCF523